MSGMRHLRVPSEATARWRDRLLGEGWLATGVGIQADGDYRLVPLTDDAPDEGSPWYEGHATVKRSSLERGPQHWRERLEDAFVEQFGPLLPTAHEVQGDVLLVTLEPEVEPYEQTIAQAMLDQFPHVRIICAGRGRRRRIPRSRPTCSSFKGRQFEHRHQRQRTRCGVHAGPEHGLL